MYLRDIYLYSVRAGSFAAAVGALWALYTVWQGQVRGRAFWLRLALTVYLAALLEITVLRGGHTLACFWQLRHSTATVVWRLFSTTRAQARAGWGNFCYHAIGNLCWFVPLGLLAPQRWPRLRNVIAMTAAGAGLSLFIETMQWVLATGTSDVDDLFWNTAGAAVGWLLWRICAAFVSASRRRLPAAPPGAGHPPRFPAAPPGAGHPPRFPARRR